MPNHEEHCLHSLKRYGVRGDDVHTWMDEPSFTMGPSHVMKGMTQEEICR